jgi:hypothetical protein
LDYVISYIFNQRSIIGQTTIDNNAEIFSMTRKDQRFTTVCNSERDEITLGKFHETRLVRIKKDVEISGCGGDSVDGIQEAFQRGCHYGMVISKTNQT